MAGVPSGSGDRSVSPARTASRAHLRARNDPGWVRRGTAGLHARIPSPGGSPSRRGQSSLACMERGQDGARLFRLRWASSRHVRRPAAMGRASPYDGPHEDVAWKVQRSEAVGRLGGVVESPRSRDGLGAAVPPAAEAGAGSIVRVCFGARPSQVRHHHQLVDATGQSARGWRQCLIGTAGSIADGPKTGLLDWPRGIVVTPSRLMCSQCAPTLRRRLPTTARAAQPPFHRTSCRRSPTSARA